MTPLSASRVGENMIKGKQLLWWISLLFFYENVSTEHLRMYICRAACECLFLHSFHTSRRRFNNVTMSFTCLRVLNDWECNPDSKTILLQSKGCKTYSKGVMKPVKSTYKIQPKRHFSQKCLSGNSKKKKKRTLKKTLNIYSVVHLKSILLFSRH